VDIGVEVAAPMGELAISMTNKIETVAVIYRISTLRTTSPQPPQLFSSINDG
jgi:hypothetical protein